MLNQLLRAMISLTAVWSVIIVLVLAVPYDDSPTREFMSARENCGGICLLGIQPGRTHVGEAMLQLENHPWLSDVRQNAPGNGYAQISWEWNGQQPLVIDDSRRGRITFFWAEDDVVPLEDSIVETITIYTHIRIYSLQNWLGETDSGAASIRPDGRLGYSVLYDMPSGILNLYAEMPCPMNMMTYWDARTRITLSIGRRNAGFVNPIELPKVCRYAQG